MSKFRAPDLIHRRLLQAHPAQAACVCVAVSPDGRRFAVGASDAVCSIWDANELICESNMGRLVLDFILFESFSVNLIPFIKK